jgi:hypothetical protein
MAEEEHPELGALPEWAVDTIAVLVTTDESGAPRAIPVSWPVRAGDREILLSLRFNRGSLARLQTDPRVGLLVLSSGNVALCARGRAQVIRSAMHSAPEYTAIAIEVDAIDDHRQGAFTVAEGIRRTVLDPAELHSLEARVAELSRIQLDP